MTSMQVRLLLVAEIEPVLEVGIAGAGRLRVDRDHGARIGEKSGAAEFRCSERPSGMSTAFAALARESGARVCASIRCSSAAEGKRDGLVHQLAASLLRHEEVEQRAAARGQDHRPGRPDRRPSARRRDDRCPPRWLERRRGSGLRYPTADWLRSWRATPDASSNATRIGAVDLRSVFIAGSAPLRRHRFAYARALSTRPAIFLHLSRSARTPAPSFSAMALLYKREIQPEHAIEIGAAEIEARAHHADLVAHAHSAPARRGNRASPDSRESPR